MKIKQHYLIGSGINGQIIRNIHVFYYIHIYIIYHRFSNRINQLNEEVYNAHRIQESKNAFKV